MKISQFESIGIGRDSSGKIVLDCTGPASMPIQEAQAWLVTQMLRIQREMAEGKKSFTVDAHVRLTMESIQQAESIADALYEHANDVDANEQAYARWLLDDAAKILQFNRKDR